MWNQYDNHFFNQHKTIYNIKIAENSANESELAVRFPTLGIEIFKT
jgi:hypothetical protein